MADIRVEQKSRGHAWVWILLVVVLLIVAALLLDRAGYIDLPVNIGANRALPAAPAQLASTLPLIHLET